MMSSVGRSENPGEIPAVQMAGKLAAVGESDDYCCCFT